MYLCGGNLAIWSYNNKYMCISNKIGPPVEGDDFFGREKEIRLANRLLDSGHSLLLSLLGVLENRHWLKN